MRRKKVGSREKKIASNSMSDCAGGPAVWSRRVSGDADGDEDDDEEDCDAGEPPPQAEVSFLPQARGIKVPELTFSRGVH